MSVWKRILIVLMLLITVSFNCFANMPVIDVTAIATAINSFYQNVTQAQRQIQQWQSEFDRIKKSAEGIANGDFSTILSSFAALTSQMSSWNISKTVFDDEWFDHALANTSDSTYSILNIMSNSEFLMNNIDTVFDTLKKNMEKMESVANNYGYKSEGGYVGSTADAASTSLSSMNSALSLVKNFAKTAGNNIQETAEIYNNLAELFNMSPEDYADFLRDIQEDTLYSSTKGTANAKSTTDLTTYIASRNKELADLRTSLSQISSSEESRKHTETTLSIENMEKEIADLEELVEWSRKMDEKIAEVAQQQTAYAYANNRDQRQEALKNTRALMDSYKAEVSEERKAELNKLYQKYNESIIDKN